MNWNIQAVSLLIGIGFGVLGATFNGTFIFFWICLPLILFSLVLDKLFLQSRVN